MLREFSERIRAELPPLQRICVAGPGAIGITLATRMALNGLQVTIAARGQSLNVIQENGLQLTDVYGKHTVRVPVAEGPDIPPQDVVFLSSKAQDLASIASWTQNLIGPDTIIVPVINGIPWWYFEGEAGQYSGRNVKSVDPDGCLKRLLPSAHVIGCVAMFTADRPAPGTARSLNPLRLIIGEIDNEPRVRTEALAKILIRSGIETRVSERVRDPLWTKVIGNLVFNPLSVATGATLRELAGDSSLAHVSRQLLNEALLVAASFGARVEMSPRQLLDFTKSMGDAKTSMLQDYEMGRPLELAAIVDAVLEFADLQGLPMPFTQSVTTITRYRSLTSTGQRSG
ncbi:2-dehydropantoate 2-reductase (plasmid) [Microvirga terrae]|uniref:2-dehydropantoate 2-reductase n=1 Tax=Microvirga terrae TaxID=2740529 RepID=A0ABY5RZB9_9HYPH|nr:2-dehydropantoate 2-reductase [Microvirga terrae]UVF22585.1 2-dehydropantoate 2-reductase [Microvirga terrae]